MTLRNFFRILWLQKLTVLGTVVLVTLGAVLYHSRAVPVYYSSASVQVDPALSTVKEGSDTKGFTIDSSITEDPVVAQAAADALNENLSELSNAASVADANDTSVTISASAGSSAEAKRIADAYAQAVLARLSADVKAFMDKLQADFAGVTQQLDTNKPSADSSSVVQLQTEILSVRYRALYTQLEATTALTTPVVVTPASPGVVAGPSLSLTIEIALLAGLLAGVGLALLRNWLDGRVVDRIDIGGVNVPVVGVLSKDGALAKSGHPGVVGVDFTNPLLIEDTRRMRTAATGLLPPTGAVLVVTGVERGVGASFTAANLAAASARAGQTTIVVSGDLRDPDMSEYFGIVPDESEARRPNNTVAAASVTARHKRDGSQPGSGSPARQSESVAEAGADSEVDSEPGIPDSPSDTSAAANGTTNGRPSGNSATSAVAQTSSTRGRLKPRASSRSGSATIARVARVARADQTVWVPTGAYGGRSDSRVRLVRTGVEGLSLLPSLVGPGQTADALASSHVRALLDQLRAQADLVVMDSPAVLDYADSVILAGYADALLLVARSRHTRSRDLMRALGILSESGLTDVGVVVNRVRRRRKAK